MHSDYDSAVFVTWEKIKPMGTGQKSYNHTLKLLMIELHGG